jgi:hypothetical protein
MMPDRFIFFSSSGKNVLYPLIVYGGVCHVKAILTSMLLATLALGLTGCPGPGTAGSTSTGNGGTNSGSN